MLSNFDIQPGENLNIARSDDGTQITVTVREGATLTGAERETVRGHESVSEVVAKLLRRVRMGVHGG